MSQTIIVGSTVISFPTAGTDASWAQAVDQFAVAVTNQLAGISSPYDVLPSVQDLNIGGVSPQTINVNSAIFDPAVLSSFNFYYSIYRTNTAGSPYTFIVSPANATIGAVYTINGINYTVNSTIVSNTVLTVTGSAPLTITNGTLTLVSGAGDATITFTTAPVSIAEVGIIEGVYNPSVMLWQLSQQFSGPRQISGQAYDAFSMSGNQLQITSAAIGGTVSNSYISYSAKTLRNNS